MISSGGNTVAGNIIGLDATGSTSIANANGVTISNGTNNTIGGTTVASRNIISGNTSEGVRITGASSANNIISGNYIGTDATGSVGVGNLYGVSIASNVGMNTIGGSSAGAGNVISGNTSFGVNLFANSQTVQGNLIGLNASGNAAIANDAGIVVNSSTNLIGGSSAFSRNVISGNTGNGIVLSVGNNTVQGNYIGTNSAGTSAVANQTGISVTSSNNQVGGTSAGARNVISGNTNEGVYVIGSSNSVLGNYIGVNAAGDSAIANLYGISLNGGSNNVIGGTTSSSRNIISGNSVFGINVAGTSASNIIQGNFIGTDYTGNISIGNSHGIYLQTGSNLGSTIGGTAVGAGNVISGNTAIGILVDGSNHVIQGNFIGTNAAGTSAIANYTGLYFSGEQARPLVVTPLLLEM